MDDRQRARLLRRDADLARLVDVVDRSGNGESSEALLAWAATRDAERRSLANETLERYTELNLLYDLADHCGSLDPAAVVLVATTQLERAIKHGKSFALVADRSGRELRPVDGLEPPFEPPAGGFRVGQGLVGAVAAESDGDIVNDPATDPRATAAEASIGALMIAPLRAAPIRRGVMMVIGERGTAFTAGEFRLLSAVAALTAPVLDAALAHQRALAAAREREVELQRQLDALRDEVEQRRREERVTAITGSDYFRSLRQQADTLRSSLNAEPNATER